MAEEWYGELRGFPAGEVWLAIRRCRREREFLPSLKAIHDAIDANHREAAEDRRQALAAMAARPANRRGAPMPPETKQALQILDARLKGELGGPTARLMIDALADKLEARDRSLSVETVEKATRTCPECATSTVEGWIDVPEDGVTAVHPCAMCRPGRHDAWQKGRLTARAGQDGFPATPAGVYR